MITKSKALFLTDMRFPLAMHENGESTDWECYEKLGLETNGRHFLTALS
jgi:hypothetical protein